MSDQHGSDGLLTRLYDRVIRLSAHPKAPAWLAALSFAESSFFPVPPDVMLGPMCVAKPRRGWMYALNCTVSSVLGGGFGYLIGRLAFEWISPWLMSSVYADSFNRAAQAFDQWGFWFILIAGFTPIPYKVFTIAAGVAGMPLIPFIAGSSVGRGGRFFLVAGLVRLLGDEASTKLRSLVDRAGWIMIFAALAIAGSWYFWRHSA